MAAWTLSLLILWKFCVKLQRFISLLVIIAFTLIFIPGLKKLHLLLELSPLLFYPFFAGYFLGFFERLVALRLPTYFYKSGYTLATLLIRGLVFGKMMLPYLFVHLLIIIIGLILDFFKIREDKKIFQSFYDYREELIKFRNLMVSGIPSKILILSKDLKQNLFMNESFQLLLNNSENLDMTQQVQELLTKVFIDKNNHNETTKIILDSYFQNCPSISTFQFLQTLTQQSLLLDDPNKKIIFNTYIQATPWERRVFEATTFSLLWDSQEAIVIILNDMTVQHQNLVLKIADANKDKMLALISHELRTPLNGILGVVQLLEKGNDDSRKRQHLKVCKASGHLLLNLVNSILDLQQIRDNKFSLKITQINLNELVHDVYDLFKFQFEQKGLKLTLNADPDLSTNFSTDQNRLKQILINLLGNALKFTFEGGVEVTATKDQSNRLIKFTVSDTGTGIKEEDQSKLFKMYGRLDQENPQTNTQGIGFGLEISNQLSKLLCEGEDGGIKFTSQVGKGTTFHFFIKEIMVLSKSRKASNNAFEETGIDGFDCDELEVLQEKPGNLSGKLSSYFMQTCSKIHLESPRNKFVRKTSISTPFFSPPRSGQIINDPKSPGTCSFLKEENNPEKLRILLVDDNPFNLLVARHLAENLGYETNSALNGKIAVEMLQTQKEQYCAVFMDLQMPVMDGYEATKILKKMMENGEISEIPIIALSANDSPSDKMRCKEIGMIDHIAKPLDEKRLKSVLNELMRDSHSSLSNDER